MKLLFLLIAAVAFASVSCERHEFDGPDGTKKLHDHGTHQHEAGSEGGAHHH